MPFVLDPAAKSSNECPTLRADLMVHGHCAADILQLDNWENDESTLETHHV